MSFSRTLRSPDLIGEIVCEGVTYYVRIWKKQNEKEGLPYSILWITFWPINDRITEKLRKKDIVETLRMADLTQRCSWLLGDRETDPEKIVQEDRNLPTEWIPKS